MISSQMWLDLLWGAFWQGTAALAVVWALCRAFPQVPARVRCWLWRAGLAKPLLWLVGAPQIKLECLPRLRTVLAQVISADFANSIPTRLTLRMMLARPAAIVGGVALCACGGRFVSELARILLRMARGRSLPSGEARDAVMAALDRLCRPAHRPNVVMSDWAYAPITMRRGLGYVIVLPEWLVAPSRRADLVLVLAHETAHINRRDLQWNWLPTVAGLVFFMNPMVWLARRELALAQEAACDEFALRATGVCASQYGALLLSMAAVRPAPAWQTAIAFTSAPASAIRRRLLELKTALSTPPAKRLSAAIVVLLMVFALVMPFSLVEASRVPEGILISMG